MDRAHPLSCDCRQDCVVAGRAAGPGRRRAAARRRDASQLVDLPALSESCPPVTVIGSARSSAPRRGRRRLTSPAPRSVRCALDSGKVRRHVDRRLDVHRVVEPRCPSPDSRASSAGRASPTSAARRMTIGTMAVDRARDVGAGRRVAAVGFSQTVPVRRESPCHSTSQTWGVDGVCERAPLQVAVPVS